MHFNICKKALLALIAISAILTGCSSGAPDEAIKQAIIENQWKLKSKVYIMDDYEITNSYTKELGDETYYIYEYDAHVRACPGCTISAMVKETATLQGSVSLVQRGDNWYF